MADLTHILAICGFFFPMCVSPGPVNIVILSSGISNGIAKTMAFILGAAVSLAVVMFVLGLGVGQMMHQYPLVMKYAGYAGTTYILYLAYKIITAPVSIDVAPVKTLTFVDGAIMQGVSPKAWVAALAGTTVLNPSGDFLILVQITVLTFTICFVSISVWAVIGAQARRFVKNEKQLKALNLASGSLLVLLALYLFTIQ